MTPLNPGVRWRRLASTARPFASLFLGIAIASAIPGVSSADSTGFTHKFSFPPTAGPNLHWISLPWDYQPIDFGTVGVLDAEDLCHDLGSVGSVAGVVRWDEATSTFEEHLCGAVDPFPLTQAISYAVRTAPGGMIIGAVAGAHDDAFGYSIPPSGGSQVTWVSVPYHLQIPENGGTLRVTAEDLCRQIGGAEVLAILRWDEAIAAYRAYGCGSTFEAPFEIERGQGYGVVNRPGQTIDWLPLRY